MEKNKRENFGFLPLPKKNIVFLNWSLDGVGVAKQPVAFGDIFLDVQLGISNSPVTRLMAVSLR